MPSIGFDFRATLAFVTDPAGCIFVINTTAYPTTSNGFTYGWESGTVVSRDRTTANGGNIAGVNYPSVDTAPAVFRCDLPAPGVVTVTAAIGDPSNAEGDINAVLLDTSATVATIAASAVTAAAGLLIDASGAAIKPANWTASNVAITPTFSTTILRLQLGPSTPGNSPVSFLGIATAGGSAITGTGAGSVSVTALGSGTEVNTGTGTSTLPSVVAAGTVAQTNTGTGTGVFGGLLVSGTGGSADSGTGAVEVGAPTASGTGSSASADVATGIYSAPWPASSLPAVADLSPAHTSVVTGTPQLIGTIINAPDIWLAFHAGDTDTRTKGWAPLLAPMGDTIASVAEVTISRTDGVEMGSPDLLLLAPPIIDPSMTYVTLWLGSGVAGVTYDVTIEIVTAGSRTLSVGPRSS